MNLITSSFSIKNWSQDDRPREKLLSKGKQVLTDAELLAILIGSGNKEESAVGLSKRIFAAYQNDLTKVGKLSVQDLLTFKGIGEAKAITIIAALELGKRRHYKTSTVKPKITSSSSVFQIMHPLLSELSHEEFWVLYLDNSNQILEKLQLSKGGITGTLVDVRLVFKNALQIGAVAFILVHNHPSGSLTPSSADKSITQKIQKGSQSLDIKVLDHLIITENAYFSFADEGILD